MKRATAALALLLPLIGGCSLTPQIQQAGAMAIEARRQANDAQARVTMAAVCDVSLGAYLREFNAVERTYAGLVCGDDQAMEAATLRRLGIERLRASEGASEGEWP